MELEEIIIKDMKDKGKKKRELPERKELLSYLHGMMLITGRVDIMYCNAFLTEAYAKLNEELRALEKIMDMTVK